MHRWLHVFRREQRRPEVLVVIWGVHSQDWMTALHPSAPVWRRIPCVDAVIHRSAGNPGISPGARWGRRTVVIPLMEEHAARRPKQYAALAPTMEALDTFGDKARFADYVGRRGLSHLCPAVYPSIAEAVFPCVIKRTNLNGGAGVEIVSSPEQARQALASEPFAGRPCVIQAAVSFAVEYVVHCVCRGGRILWHTVYAYEFPDKKTRKAGAHHTIRRATIPAAALGALGALLLPLGFSGPCNIDCTIDSDGRLVVFEINPRMGGSLMRPENTDHLAECLSEIIVGAHRGG